MIAIFDLDGTLALNEHRHHFLQEKPKNWKAFHSASDNDEINYPLSLLWDRFEEDFRFIFTGRSDEYKMQTENWLIRNGLEWYEDIYMRKKGDKRDDTIVKKEMFHQLQQSFCKKYNSNFSEHIVIIFEDRQRVVDMWREMGLTCCQVAPGDF